MMDMTLLRGIAGHSPDGQAQTLRSFRLSMQADANGLRQSVSGNDFDAVVRWAHRLHGASAMIGATGVAAASAEVQLAAAARDEVLMCAELAELEGELARLDEYLGLLLETAE